MENSTDEMAVQKISVPLKNQQPKSKRKKVTEEPRKDASPVDLLYNEMSKVFGNSNQRQLFSIVWPGTILDYESYNIPKDHVGPLPKTVHIAQSVLFDQYYPVAPITQPDGSRVSDRYKVALEAYGPIPNERLIELQRIIRGRLDQKVQVEVNGETKTVSLLEKFNILQSIWIEKKIDWGREKSVKYFEFKRGGDSDWWEQFIYWYGNNADGYIEAINGAYNRMIADFPMTEFEDALAILDTHDGAALLRAKQEVRNAVVQIPPEVGSTYYVTNSVPHDWGVILKPSSTFRDLLASPEAQQHYLDLCIDQLQQQIFAWNATLAQIPVTSKSEIENALNSFNEASKKYFEASNKLIEIYTDNTVLAVKTYMQYKQGDLNQKTDGANTEIDKLNKQTTPPGTSEKIDTKKFEEIVNKIGDAQKLLIEGTGSMVSCGQELGNKAKAYLETKAGKGLSELITPVLDKLNAQIELTIRQIRNFDSAAGRAIQLNGDSLPILDGEKEENPEFSSVADSLDNQRWTEVTLTVKKDDMKTGSEASTSFSQTNWGVDLFFGSAGGQSVEASQAFSTEFMNDKSEIQIGMLATKVLIERPWMHPEIFSNTKNFFKAIDGDITISKGFNVVSGELISKTLGGQVDAATAKVNCEKVNKGKLPAYPVALLLVKDVTIKIKFDIAKTSTLQQHSEKNESNGGGFLCFSVSNTQSSSSDKKSASSYSMGGDYVFRMPAPQIMGVWNQILPADESEYLDSDDLQRILKFNVHNGLLKNVSSVQPYEEEVPTKHDSVN